MISFVQISESANGLVLEYPLWAPIALGALALLLLAFAIARRARLVRRWPVSLAVVFAAWAAIYTATYQTTISDDGGSAYAFLRSDHFVRWQDAADIYLEQRRGGSDWQVVVIDRAQRAYAFDVAELSVDDRDRVMAYMVDRMPAHAFDRTPELMKRHAPVGARPASFLQDQQI